MQLFLNHPATSKTYLLKINQNETFRTFIRKTREILNIPKKLKFICIHYNTTIPQWSQKTLKEINVYKENTINFYFTFGGEKTTIAFRPQKLY